RPLLPSATLFFTATTPTEIYTLSLHDALPISGQASEDVPGETAGCRSRDEYREKLRAAVLKLMDERRLDALIYPTWSNPPRLRRSEEHTSELQSLAYLVCRLLLEKKKKIQQQV